MMVGLRLVVSIVNCAILTIAGIMGVVSLGLFADANNHYKDVLSNKPRQCFLFTTLTQIEVLDKPYNLPRYGSNGVCNFVVAADVIVLLLILASGVAMVMTFITVKYVIMYTHFTT